MTDWLLIGAVSVAVLWWATLRDRRPVETPKGEAVRRFEALPPPIDHGWYEAVEPSHDPDRAA